MKKNTLLRHTRRKFLYKASIAGLLVAVGRPLNLMATASNDLSFLSGFLKVVVSATQPVFSLLSIDFTGKEKFSASPVVNTTQGAPSFVSKRDADAVEYYTPKQKHSASPAWKIAFHEKGFTLTSITAPDNQPFELLINQHLNHATVLGIMNDKNKVSLPCIIHFPDIGTIRVNSDVTGAYLFVDAKRYVDPHFVKIQFPQSSAKQKIAYCCEVVEIHPDLSALKSDMMYGGVRKNFINIFQMNPQLQVLANNSSSDPCAFTLFKYSEAAKFAPPLAEGLTAMMLVKQTLEKYLHGFKGYGMKGFKMFGFPGVNPDDDAVVYDYLDTYPSLICAACDYVLHTKDITWLAKNYEGILVWVENMLAYDSDGDGLLEYPLSGNSGSWGDTVHVKARPANWWDTVGFGHKDAYSNALAYKALTGLAEICRLVSRSEDVKRFSTAADKLKSIYYPTFFNEKTGVLAGWKSADGNLHDYYFTFVNGVAITYGLVEKEKANRIMDSMLSKMAAVGYTDFSLGLPGNLIPIRKEDYVHNDKRWGGGDKEDGSDGFQIYENGGATACYTYFTVRALQLLDRYEEADVILKPIVKSIGEAGFSGKCENGMTRDWKNWKGVCWGYEGFLVDNYLVLLAVLFRKK